MKTNRKIPYDFWNYGINPITGYRISDKTLNQKQKRLEKKALLNK